MSDKSAAIANTLTAMLAGIHGDEADLYRSASDDPMVQGAVEALRERKIDEFFYALQYPFENMVRGLLETELPDKPAAQFLMMHSQFVEGHLEALIKKYEGWPCCADKSQTMMGYLLRFFLTDEPIVFDFTQEYTFHLPKKVLNTHESLVEFFTGLRHLYYGDPEHYLKALAKVMAGIANEKPAES